MYKQDVIDLCSRRRHSSAPDGCSSPSSQKSGSHSSQEPWRALLLLIPVRLGGEALNPVYTPAIQTILANDMCLGIIGGKPKHSVFFVGFQGKFYIKLLRLESQGILLKILEKSEKVILEN